MLKENENFTYALSLVLPEDQRTITDGDLISESVDSEKVTRRYERRSPGFDIPLIASANTKVEVHEMDALKVDFLTEMVMVKPSKLPKRSSNDAFLLRSRSSAKYSH